MQRLLTISEVSELTRLSKATIYAYVATRRIPYLKLGTRTMFDPAALEKWVQERAVSSKGVGVR